MKNTMILALSLISVSAFANGYRTTEFTVYGKTGPRVSIEQACVNATKSAIAKHAEFEKNVGPTESYEVSECMTEETERSTEVMVKVKIRYGLDANKAVFQR